MAKKQDKQNQKSLVVNLRYVATPDGNARLSRALGILLRAAARSTTESEDDIKGKKGLAGNSLTTGEEGDPHK